MRIEKIKLINYRNHLDKVIEFSNAGGITIIEGPNGAGKTNILEAIYLLSTTKSQRSQYDKDFINYHKKFCTINAVTYSETHDENFKLELQITAGETGNTSQKKTKVNGVAKSAVTFTGYFNSVLFSPQDIELITGSPSGRRGYMDILLGQTDKKYKKYHSEYVKALRQRNKILELINKTGTGRDQLEFWTEKIIETGTYLQEQRTNMLEFFHVRLKELKGDDNDFDIVYKKNEISHERILNYKFEEVASMTTLVGPHRDDFEVLLGKRNSAYFASRGQQREAVLYMKISEIDFITKVIGERPVLLLDDIFSEFDEKHREITMELAGIQQSIITSAVSDKFISGPSHNFVVL